MTHHDRLILGVHWEQTLERLLTLTERFPKHARHTFAARQEGLALDVLGQLTIARYSSGAREAEALLEADLMLAQLRVLWRLSHKRQLVSHAGYEQLSRDLDEAGRMLGGWRQRGERPLP